MRLKHYLQRLTPSPLAAQTSPRRWSNGLLLLLGIALLLVGFSYWAMQRLLREQNDTVRFHFARLMENVQRHEAFLHEVAEQSAHGEMFYQGTTARYSARQVPGEGPNIYEGYEFPYSVPFGLNFNHRQLDASELGKVFTVGVHLSSLYSAFWSTTHYQSPQIFLFNDHGNFDITVPSNGVLRTGTHDSDEPLTTTVSRVARHLKLNNEASSNGQVHWEKYQVPHDQPRAPAVLAYVNIRLKPQHQRIHGAAEWSVAASLLSMNQVNDVERILEGPIYDRFTLIAPDGRALIGSIKAARPLHDGLNVNRDGWVFKVRSGSSAPWIAIYTVSFASYFGQLLWPLLGVLLLIVGGASLSWLINRWYRARVLLPAQQAQLGISESEAFSQALIDTAPTGLCVVRRADFTVLLENQRAQQWQGTAKLVAVLDLHHDLADIGEIRLDIDGRHLQVGFVSTRYRGQDVLLCAFNDITRHVEDALALEKARRSADAANEAKTRFLATMSHEIRTPLYGVLGTLELLGLTSLSSRQQAYLQTIQRSSTTLFQLISDVLDIAKIESEQMLIESVVFCPRQLLEDTLHTYAAFAKRKGLTLQASTDPLLPARLLGDPVRIRQVLNNLVSNAIKFTERGQVSLRLQLLGRDEQRVRLQWQVGDTGIGIDQAQQQQLFTPFFQVRDASGEAGAGLGLAICQKIAELMAGQLTVTSEPGRGSCFALQLDMQVPSVERASSLDAPHATAATCAQAPLGLRILVAEDNPINQAIIKEQLEALGCTVRLADNGEQALRHWCAQRFDVLLTDVNMPVMNGYELAAALRRFEPHAPIIGVTANAMREEGARCLAVGMNAWLVKPLSLQTLRQHLLGCGAPATAADEHVVLSPRLREIFGETMGKDLIRLHSAREAGDAERVAARLHSIAGAFAAVQAPALAQACSELEGQLGAGVLDAQLDQRLQQLAQRIQTLLERSAAGAAS